MKFTYSWIKDFLNLRLTPQALADKLTMAGLEVKSVERREGDFIFEAEVTSNRPDWLSIIGIAREAAVLTNSVLRTPHSGLNFKNKPGIKIEITIQDKTDCPLYSAIIMRGVKVGPSPEWLKKRLELVGLRSVNNIVDATNYCLWERGEPLHAFDLDKLSGSRIAVRRAREGEAIFTIDGQRRALDRGILVIADDSRPVAIAGVMGGKESEVTGKTTNILLEAAIFNPIVIRRSRQKLGLQTDSSYRFERGVDYLSVMQARLRAAGLIQKLAGGDCVFTKSAGARQPAIKTITLDLQTLNKIIGVEIKAQRVKEILSGLGFKLKASGKNKLRLGVPAFRQDVRIPQDLVEEVARIYGYELIPSTLPKVQPAVTIRGARELVSEVKNILAGLGMHEAITYSLVDRPVLESFAFTEQEPVRILNPLSAQQEVLRSSLIPSLCRAVAYNLNQKQDLVSLFEIAPVFKSTGTVPSEELTLAAAVCGFKDILTSSGVVRDEMGLLHLKGIAEQVFEAIGINGCVFKQGPSGRVSIFAADHEVGQAYQLNSRELFAVEIKNKDVFVLELSLEKLFRLAHVEKQFNGLAQFPGIKRDLSLVVKDGVLVQDILNALKAGGGKMLCEARVVDYYQGKQIPAGFRSITISCLYRSAERTLSEEDIAPAHEAALDGLKQLEGVKLR